MERWKARTRHLKREVKALSIAARDPRTPWYAKLLAGGIIAYALSPIDLIPDPIPVLGYLDDLVLLPVAILLLLRLIPDEAMRDARSRADDAPMMTGSAGTIGAALIVLLWLVVAGLLLLLGSRLL